MVVHPAFLLITLATTVLAYLLGRTRSTHKITTELTRLRAERQDLEARAERHRITADELRKFHDTWYRPNWEDKGWTFSVPPEQVPGDEALARAIEQLGGAEDDGG